jgi:hypothetical protein
VRGVISAVVLCFLLRGEEIISEFEYGQMLYNDPRGVSCMPCHGVKGEGREIVKYREKGREFSLSAPSIIDKSFQEYKMAIVKGPKIMPRYFLTDEELRAIYLYVEEANREKESSQESERREDVESVENIGDIDGIDDSFDVEDTELNQTVDSGGLGELEE